MFVRLGSRREGELESRYTLTHSNLLMYADYVARRRNLNVVKQYVDDQ